MAHQDPIHAQCLDMIQKGVPGHAQGKYDGQMASYFCYNSVVSTFYIAGSTLTKISPVRNALIDGWVDGSTKATRLTFRRRHFRERRNTFKKTDKIKYETYDAFYHAHRDEMIGD